MYLKVLEDAQIAKLHDASLRILKEVGVQVPHADIRSRFREAGASVDDDSDLVRIPQALVEHSLEQAGKSFTIYGRDRQRQAVFGKGQRNYNSISGEALWIDDDTGERRYATLADVATAARLGDGLPDLTIVGAMSDPHELPPSYRVVEVAAALLRNTTKPIGLWFHDRASSRFLVELLTAIAGSEEGARQYPVIYPFLEPISPLRFPNNGVDLLYETARLNLPVPIGPMAQTGMSAPGTLAGTLAQENAEILAGVCITQLIRPGMPVCYGGIPHAFDMRTTQMIFAGPEQALMAIAMTQVGKHYGLPVYINVGLTDSKTVDAQAGMETGVTLICGALAGADIFGHLGICGVDQASSLDMLLMQHELIGFVERIMRGLRFDDETLGVDVVKEVGPGGTFIDQEHTLRHFREELWFPRLLDRQFYDAWVDSGSTATAERCRQEKERILSEHEPQPLPDELEREVRRITDSARRHLGEGQ
ncbi:MAG: trimethylamine methyltransferase family protein [Armatimonadota bacterium]|nr:MAG: trimethylamine methyltransferase family protein [Armatimonadota bacterium]